MPSSITEPITKHELRAEIARIIGFDRTGIAFSKDELIFICNYLDIDVAKLQGWSGTVKKIRLLHAIDNEVDLGIPRHTKTPSELTKDQLFTLARYIEEYTPSGHPTVGEITQHIMENSLLSRPEAQAKAENLLKSEPPGFDLSDVEVEVTTTVTVNR